MPVYFKSSSDSPILLRQNLTTAAPSEFSIADFNGDGKLDVAISYFLYPLDNRAVPIRLLSGDGAGRFIDITAATFPNGAPATVFGRENVLADFNGDGRSDVFFAGHGYDAPPFPGEHNALMLSSGAAGAINASDRLPNLDSNFSHSAEGADIDGDGDIDIFVGNGGSPAPYFLINDGHGNFTLDRSGLPAVVATGQIIGDTEAFLDVDRDGDLDMFLGTPGAEFTPNLLLLNDGHGHFTVAPTNPPLPQTLLPLQSTLNVDAKSFDINGDGRADILSSYALYSSAGDASRYVQVLINRGDNTFADETTLRLPSSLQSGLWITRLHVVDFNGDGYLDIVAGNKESAPIFLNDGAGHFIQMPSNIGSFGPYETRVPVDIDGDGRMDLFVWQGVYDGAEHYRVDFGIDPGLIQTGTAAADGFMGDADDETFDGLGGDDVIFAGAGNDTITGGAGDDFVVGGAGRDEFRLSGAASDYHVTASGTGFAVQDLRNSASDGKDTLIGIEVLRFSNATAELGDPTISLALENILRQSAVLGSRAVTSLDLGAKVAGGQLTFAGAVAELVKAAGATTSVATLAYQFFTGKIPGLGGIDYLVSPTGPNANNLNSAYYQNFNLENRYINFAVNLGREGEGKAKFQAEYGSLSLTEATKKAYGAIFGATPTDAKVALLLSGGRDLYFDVYGKDGLNGLGTKAAMVGWLLAEAVKADLGAYAKANDAFLADLADGANFAIDLIGVYGKPEFNYSGA